MKKKIKVIIKRPGEKDGREVLIENTLQAFQEAVGGHIEVVSVGHGAILICGIDGEELADVPFSMDLWREILEYWGN